MGSFEIDVATQLFPNPLTIVVQLLATTIIFVVAKKYLFKYGRDFLIKRQNKMQEVLDDAHNKQKEAEAYLADAKEDLDKARMVAADLEVKAKGEAMDMREKLIEDAKNEADLIIDRANRQVVAKQKEAEKELKQHIVDVALLASQKLLADETKKLDAKALDKIVEELKNE